MKAIEQRLADVAGYILTNLGGSAEYIKLLKLMYIADRESFRENQTAITGDHYVSMNQGPVLSIAYNFIRGNVNGEIWNSLFQTVGFGICLKSTPPEPGFSKADRKVLDRVMAEFGSWDKWKLVDLTHTFPEWEFPNGSSTAITLENLLKGAGFENDVAAAIASEELGMQAMDRLFSAA
ncbi:Panacea domain-containing protein [Luteolibacter sp. GHJ8]|uniref:Panacea domain-containing protein n=1 Tax=Luteolibacter rhizosphaerae TaxID=2989719 RepID=A0ABT3G918_9BACT|nr:Panacea domain-containing protein [Luteolibacter rhizosphaerae]MCW1916346.1 Panacea domain-containing protein [Luteolibacter rhizosphaerae]